MVGLDARATMDLDATIKGTNVSVADVEMIISRIISIPLDDGVSFRIKMRRIYFGKIGKLWVLNILRAAIPKTVCIQI